MSDFLILAPKGMVDLYAICYVVCWYKCMVEWTMCQWNGDEIDLWTYMEMYEMYVFKAIGMSIIWNKGYVSLDPLLDSLRGKFMLNVSSHDDWIINWWELHAG